MPINQELRDFLAQFIPECDLKVLDSYGRNEMPTEQPPSPPSDNTLDSESSETDFRPPTEQLSSPPSDSDSSSESESSDTDFRHELDAIFNFDDPVVSTRYANSLKEEMGAINEAASIFNAINCDNSMPASIEFPKKLLEKATSAAAEIVIDYIGDAIFCEDTQILLQLMTFAPDDHASYQMAKFIRAAHSKNILRSASNFWLYGLVTPLSSAISFSIKHTIDIHPATKEKMLKIIKTFPYFENINKNQLVPCCILPVDLALRLTPVPELFLSMLSFASGVSVMELKSAHDVTTDRNMLVLPAGAAHHFMGCRLTFDKNAAESRWFGLRYALTRFKKLRTNMGFDYANPNFIKVHRFISQVAHSYVGRAADQLGDGPPRNPEELVEEAYCDI